ncbi:MAG: class I SAM-dependent methyltransferase [Planctomycetota bacterium]|jgi:ubiquinone/menaquinone biosynthesis C-methylase UbiE
MAKRKSGISIAEFYEEYAEGDRLFSGLGQLEFERTKRILQRFLPPPPATILDVGGGTGPYSLWLAKLGYQVHLIEPSQKLVEQARQSSQQQTDAPLASCVVGDARVLDFPDKSAETVLMFGPLYHLTEEKDRNQALREACRVLKGNGVLFAAAISRFASAIDGLTYGLIKDPIFLNSIKQDLTDGQHCNPTKNIFYFTDAFFHLPSELKKEIEAADFSYEQLFPIEGIGVFVRDFDKLWKDKKQQNHLLEIIERTEKEGCILGVSPHLLCVARKKA